LQVVSIISNQNFEYFRVFFILTSSRR